MTQIISRTYEARQNADAAAADLRKAGFDGRDINLVASSTGANVAGPAEAPADDITARIKKGGVVGALVDAYAERIGHGETLVSVVAYFGYAALATEILERHGPAETGLPEQGYEKTPPDPAAPLSSALGWRVLLHDPAPLSSALKLPLLFTRRPRRRSNAELVDDPAPFSRAIKQPVLTDRPTILSSRFGWRVLWGGPAPLSARLGVPVLSKEQELPRARFGLPLLSDHPAPLSSLLGLKLLLEDPAPLSQVISSGACCRTSRRVIRIAIRAL